MSFFDEHGGTCTPIKPCTNCRSISFLRNNLGDEKFEKFLVIVGEVVSTAPSLLDKEVDHLEIGARARTALGNAGITTVGKLIRCSAAELQRLDGFGDTSLKEVENALRSIDLRLEKPEE